MDVCCVSSVPSCYLIVVKEEERQDHVCPITSLVIGSFMPLAFMSLANNFCNNMESTSSIALICLEFCHMCHPWLKVCQSNGDQVHALLVPVLHRRVGLSSHISGFGIDLSSAGRGRQLSQDQWIIYLIISTLFFHNLVILVILSRQLVC